MRRTALLLITMALALLLACGSVFAQVQPTNSGGGQRYIIVLKHDVSHPRGVAEAHASQHGARVTQVYEYALKGYAAKIPREGIRGIRQDPRVDFVEPDRVQHAFALETPNPELPTGIDRIEGDQSSAKSGDHTGTVDVDIAVLDTGIQKNHPDLNVAGGHNCSLGSTGAYGDGNGHGTHVAGTAAARDNGSGVVGVAPGARLWSMKVLDSSGIGFTSWIICGIDRVTKHNKEAGLEDIEVANMSLGGSGGDSTCGGSDSYHNAICRSVNKNGAYGNYPGATYAVAAGNSSTNLKGSRPATYDEVLTVTAVADFNGKPSPTVADRAIATCRSDVDDTAANFSNFTTVGHTDAGHTIAAPGVCIKSTWKGSAYNTISGTSMASPHVAGTAALCIATAETTGECTGGPLDVISDLRGDAAAQPATYGFAEDAHQVTTSGSRHYGYLEYAGGY
jgi:subtilisin family serine protease